MEDFSKFANNDFKKIFFNTENLFIVTEQIIKLYKEKPELFIDNLENAEFFLSICINLLFSKAKKKAVQTLFFKNKHDMSVKEQNQMSFFLEMNKQSNQEKSNTALDKFFKTTFGMFKNVFKKNLFTTQNDCFKFPLFFKLCCIKAFNPFTLNIIDYYHNDNNFIKCINDRKSIMAKSPLNATGSSIEINFYNNLFLINPAIYLALSKKEYSFKIDSVTKENPLFYLQSFESHFFPSLDILNMEKQKNTNGMTCIEKIVNCDIHHMDKYYLSVNTCNQLNLLSDNYEPEYKNHNILLNSLKATIAFDNPSFHPEELKKYLQHINLENLVFIPLSEQARKYEDLKFLQNIHPFQLFQRNHLYSTKNLKIISSLYKHEYFSKDVFGYLIKQRYEHGRGLSKYFCENNKLTESEIIAIFEEGIKYKNLTSLYTLELIYDRNPKLDMKLSILNEEQKLSALQACLSVFKNTNNYPKGFFGDQFYISRAFMHLFTNENLKNKIQCNKNNAIAILNYYATKKSESDYSDIYEHSYLLKGISNDEKQEILQYFLKNDSINQGIIITFLEHALLKDQIIYNDIKELTYKKRI